MGGASRWAALCVLWLTGSVFAQPAANLQTALERLPNTGCVLMIAAHPDDEHTGTLAYYSLGKKWRTGYLSLTRGEGGQNVIGPEQGALLGAIRTQELLAARRIDGAEQFFTSALDFGYSKTAEETLRKWDRNRVLGEIVRVIREFRPDLIILRWKGTSADGHGHHQASAILGREAFAAAADPNRYPEQNLSSWQAKQLVVFNRDSAPNAIAVPVGDYNPLIGLSYTEIEGISRSQHRSQAMGSEERVGASSVYLIPEKGQNPTPEPFPPVVAGALAKVADTFQPKHPEASIQYLLDARRLLRSLSGELAVRKLRELDEAVVRCAGLVATVSSGLPIASEGAMVPLRVQVVNRSSVLMTLDAIDITGAPVIRPAKLEKNTPLELQLAWKARTPIPQAYFRFRIGAEPILVTRPLQYKYVDRVLGQRTQPFAVVPPVSVRIASHTILFPDTSPREVAVSLAAYTESATGTLALDLPAGWTSTPKSQTFRLDSSRVQSTALFNVTPPPQSTTADVRAVATIGGREIADSVTVIRYPHIPTQTVVEPARARFVRTDARVLSRKVGYIEGAGDDVPDALRQLGCDVKLVTPDELATGALNQYDAIVTGVRAFNLRSDLRSNIGRLNQYVENGGRLVVQYNTADKSFGLLGPYPFRVGNSRISVEESPVRIVSSDHSLMRTPNAITPADFDGWIQERGLYFPIQWDSRYQTILSSNDPAEPPLPGGILFARYGKGSYVYTSYSWFRQLPAGVPGSYRIFANLVSQ